MAHPIPASPHYSFGEYLRLEEFSNVKHEFVRGVIYAMAGNSERHSAIERNLTASLRSQLRGRRCQPYTSNLKVRVEAADLAAYPDALVICGPIEKVRDAKPTAVLNPTALFEILSPDSTEGYDRETKLPAYMQIPSARVVVFVHQNDVCVEVWQRGTEGEAWTHTVHEGRVAVALAMIDCVLDLSDLYSDLPTE
jgi:Uma2 family endonuclease